MKNQINTGVSAKKFAYEVPTVWSETIVIEKGFATTPGTAPELDENELEID
jgi:hypothetical protein